ncbi:MAG: tRNA lysidine(34) synthetase TilS [Steroidobacteraceae bacterium]
MAFTLGRFERELRAILDGIPPPGSGDGLAAVCVALSGGLDSTVLLSALAQLRAGQPDAWPALRAIHIDHALHPDSSQWSLRAAELAGSLQVPLQSLRVDAAAARGESPEAAARNARLAAFRACLRPGEVLATAHHADDQVETILLQWLRGGGLAAVGGMAPLAPFEPHGWHVRPLLAFRRAELEAWARAQGLQWSEDPSNGDRRFDRNYLRHEVLPAVQARWPGAAQTIGRVAGFARDALATEAAAALGDLQTLLCGVTLDLELLSRLPAPRRRAALRAWLDGLGLPRPPSRTLEALERDMALAAVDRVPETRWPGAIVRRYRGRLHADPPGTGRSREGVWSDPDRTAYAWTADARLELVPDVGAGLRRDSLPRALQVATRTGGEMLLPAGAAHHRPLRKWLQEHGVLPWRRAELPLLRDERGRLVAVADLACGAQFAAQPGEPSWRIVWHGRGAVTQPDALRFSWPRHPPIR